MIEETKVFYREQGKLLCWFCREPLEESEAVKVRTNPHLPEWQSKSTTLVHPGCHDRRGVLDQIRLRKAELAPLVSGDVKRITDELINLYEDALRRLAKT